MNCFIMTRRGFFFASACGRLADFHGQIWTVEEESIGIQDIPAELR